MPQILVIDDDVLYLKMIRDSLKREGYSVTCAQSGLKAIQLIRKEKPDLVLLDMMLQGENGLDLIKKIRSFSGIPVIIVSGCRKDERDVIRGLDLGADDYLFKPYSLSELLARARAILRRTADQTEEQEDHLLINGRLKINFARAEVRKDDKVIPLSSTEYRLLLTIAQNMGKVVSPETLLTNVWGESYQGEKEILWVSIARLRQKLEEDSRRPEFIITKTGLGYIMPKIDSPDSNDPPHSTNQ
jgi:DNA-binding response OmpR family regulator